MSAVEEALSDSRKNKNYEKKKRTRKDMEELDRGGVRKEDIM